MFKILGGPIWIVIWATKLESQFWRANLGSQFGPGPINHDRWILSFSVLDQGLWFFAILCTALGWVCRSETWWLL